MTSRSAVALAVAFAVALVLALALRPHFLSHDRQVDTGLYDRWGSATVAGRVPYRDFALEYPPGALPAFALPAVASDHRPGVVYSRWFAALMGAFAAGIAAAQVLTLRALRAGPARIATATVGTGAALLVLGYSIVFGHYDLWPAFLTALALALLARGRPATAHVLLGVGVAAKIYPIVLAPIFVAYAWRRVGRAAAVRYGTIAAGTVAVIVLPFVALAPQGVWDNIVRQTTRPLQIESLGGAVLLAAHRVGHSSLAVSTSHGSDNLVGTGAGLVSALTVVLQLAMLGWIWFAFARGPATRERLLRYSTAAVAAFVVFGKVLSPQFLVWLVPLVPLLRGRTAIAAQVLFAATVVLTQIWFPNRYLDLLTLDPGLSWLVVARDVLLVALVGALVWSSRRWDEAESSNLAT
jgi:uncharacterized membrane protein